LVVTQELVDRTVELVGSRLGRHDDLRRSLAVLSRVDAGLNLELLDRVDRGPNDEGVEVRIRVLHAVQRVAVELLALAGDRNRLISPLAALATIGLSA